MSAVSEVEGEDDGGTCTYTGRLVNNKRDGRGTTKWPNGRMYDGEWRDNMRDGWGVCRWPGGSWYEGLWRGNSAKRGTFHDGDGGEWEGEWEAGRLQGWGVQRRKNSAGGGGGQGVTVYEGEWHRHEWHGTGTWKSPDGSGDIYHGHWDHGKKSGYGRMLFGDDENGHGGGSYAGGWKDDMFHGKGVLVWHGGPKYEGDWSCGREHGSGMKTRTRDGTFFTGEWEMGVPKVGIKIWPNGDMFTGTFTEDCAGEGTLVLESETRLFKGTLENGVFKEHGIGGISYTPGGASPQITEVAKMKAKINELEQKLGQQTKSFEHTLAHVQRGVWMKLIPDHRKCNCVMKKVVITLDSHIIKFPEPICTLCPLDKVVKMEIDKRFGLDESQQVLSFSSTVKDEKLSPLGTPLTHLPDDVLPEIKVTLTPVLTIRESELRSISSVGRGSYGMVEKCVHIPSGREVAVKTMHDEIASEFNISRFMLEAEIVSGLRHPNILKCIGTCTTRSGHLQIVSELLCCSLRKLLTHRRLSFNEATAIALNVAKGMDSLHRFLPATTVECIG
ncbi:MORN repeat protein [Pelomyxa schiedti]|nr:MORN repeat protein [Pelomyxa schiedti]